MPLSPRSTAPTTASRPECSPATSTPHDMPPRLRVGAVMIDAGDFRIDAMPFGGSKHSGVSREGVPFAVEAMTGAQDRRPPRWLIGALCGSGPPAPRGSLVEKHAEKPVPVQPGDPGAGSFRRWAPSSRASLLIADSAIIGHLGTQQLAGLGVASAVLVERPSPSSASSSPTHRPRQWLGLARRWRSSTRSRRSARGRDLARALHRGGTGGRGPGPGPSARRPAGCPRVRDRTP